MAAVTVEIDAELASLIGKEHESIDRTARELMVFELYRRGTISGGRAAELLRISRYDFIMKASALGIPYFDLTPEEWEAEVQVVRSR